MDPTTLRLIQGAAGAAGDATYVDDVFSTFLYTATGSSLALATGQDLDAEGGMVWLKSRSAARNNVIVDSARGVDGSGNYKSLYPNLADAEYSPGSAANAVATSFNSNGLTLGNNANTNTASDTAVAWSFRKAPGFFTCVQYTGTGSNRTVAHDLESTPGMMIVKCTNTAGTDWLIYHTSLGPTKADILNEVSGPVGPSANYWNNTAPTSTEFTVGISNDVNTDGDTYIAYLFANDEPVFGTNEDESIIKCGSFTTNASGTLDAPVDLGFQPQFILLKGGNGTDPGGNWFMFDTMRGLGGPESNSNTLKANSSQAEQNRSAGWLALTSTGFDCDVFALFSANKEIPYMAIRRPNKPPSAATDVFSATAYTGNQTNRTVSNNLCDFAILSDLDADALGWSTLAQYVFTRLLGPDVNLATSTLAAETPGWANTDKNGDYFQFDQNNGFFLTNLPNYVNNSGTDYVLYNFTRAPGFADVVTYTGTGSTLTVNHNLGVKPELIITRNRDTGSNQWGIDFVDADELGLFVSSAFGAGALWTTTTSTSLTTPYGGSMVNGAGDNFVLYLFASFAGISKIGTYSGTGSDVDVNCGFSSGARFILIKRTDSTGDWYVYDTSRGIVGGNDPYILLNTDAAEVTNTDYIDPLASGFTVTSSAPDALNADGGTYLFLAIA